MDCATPDASYIGRKKIRGSIAHPRLSLPLDASTSVPVRCFERPSLPTIAAAHFLPRCPLCAVLSMCVCSARYASRQAQTFLSAVCSCAHRSDVRVYVRRYLGVSLLLCQSSYWSRCYVSCSNICFPLCFCLLACTTTVASLFAQCDSRHPLMSLAIH